MSIATEKKQPLLTVNVVTYNHAPFIAPCLDSVLEQKTDFDFIVRIFDDCSTDGTIDILRAYKEKYPDKIELYLSEKNLGMKDDTFLNGLRSFYDITTKYFVTIDGDDFRMNPAGFQKQVDALEKNPECSFCQGKTFNGEFSFPSLKQGIYSKEYVLNHSEKLFFSNIGSRVVRTECFRVSPDYPSAFILDICQFYTLIDKGDLYFMEDDFLKYNCGSGYAGFAPSKKNKLKPVAFFSSVLSRYNDYTGYVFEKNLVQEIYTDLHYLYTTLHQKSKKKKKPFKAFLHFVLPPFVREMFHCIKNLNRKIKKRKNALQNKVERFVA